jgi:hypothetical protein
MVGGIPFVFSDLKLGVAKCSKTNHIRAAGNAKRHGEDLLWNERTELE